MAEILQRPGKRTAMTAIHSTTMFEPLRLPGRRVAAARARRCAGAALLALGLASASTAPAAAADTAAQASVLYHNYCSVCHGDHGNGRSRASGALSTAPRDFTSAASKAELTRERIVLAITHGRPGTAMVGWTTQLSAQDIEALADHLLTRFVQPSHAAAAPAAAVSGTHAHGGREVDAVTARDRAAADPAAHAGPRTGDPVDMAQRAPDGPQGNLTRGAAFYAANCAACHGAGGDGAGPRASFINPKPRNFTDAASRARLNRPALVRSVAEGRVGTDMPAWDKVATPQQIADVAEYVFQTFIAPTPATQPRP